MNNDEMLKTENSEITHKHHRRGRGATLVFLCFVAGFMGAWVFLKTGLVDLSSTQTITNNREKIVSQEGEIMSNIVDKVSPSVVSVTTTSVDPDAFGVGSVSTGAGTGMIISNDGYILTNKHVVGSARSVSVVTSQGKIYDNVGVVGVDPFNDLAFLKIDSKDNFTPVKLADSSKVKIGEKVIAVGNALGEYQNSVTSGIISGIGRPITAQAGQGTEKLDNLFQTDAAINPGNSGGPLLNLSGEVIGVNTAIAADAEGIGFTIPSNATKGLVKHLLASGKVEKAYLGVHYVGLTPQIASEYKLSMTTGAYILNDSRSDAVVPGSPADKAGIKNQDIITKVNNTKVDAKNGLALLLAEFSPGDRVNLTIQRGTTSQTFNVSLSSYKE